MDLFCTTIGNFMKRLKSAVQLCSAYACRLPSAECICVRVYVCTWCRWEDREYNRRNAAKAFSHRSMHSTCLDLLGVSASQLCNHVGSKSTNVVYQWVGRVYIVHACVQRGQWYCNVHRQLYINCKSTCTYVHCLGISRDAHCTIQPCTNNPIRGKRSTEGTRRLDLK